MCPKSVLLTRQDRDEIQSWQDARVKIFQIIYNSCLNSIKLSRDFLDTVVN